MRHANLHPSFSHSLLLRFFVLIVFFMVALPLWAQEDPIARVLKSRGEVLLKRQAEADFVTALLPAMNLFNGDAIRAGEDGFTSLIFLDDKTLLKIKANSQFQFVESQNTRTLDLQYGTIRSTLPQPIKSFRVETPVSVASVKATDFWLIHDLAAGVDRAYGMEGVVEILNRISGITIDLTPGLLVISTAAGQVVSSPYSPDELPTDPEEEEPQPEPEPEEPEEEIEEEVPEEVGEAEAVEPAAPLEELFIGEEPPVEELEAAPAAEAEAPEEEAAAPKKAGPGLGLGLGSVTIDGTVYYQIALRPEFSFGKIGIGLDLVGYMDAQGNFRKDEWDEPSDYLDKILYLRYGTDQDPFFFKIGAMPQVQYGFGVLMNSYSNMTEFPQVRRVGFELGGRVRENISLKGFTADLKEFGDRGGLVGLRGTYRVSKKFPLTVGVNVVGDLNQYGGLKDKDDDGVPDLLDDFPEDNDYGRKYAVDYDGDGLADNDPGEWDIDGDGITDTLDSRVGWPYDPVALDTLINRKPEPFNKKTTSRSTFGISADLSYPIFSSKSLSLVAYAEAGRLNYGGKLYSMSKTDSASTGFGLVGPGLGAQIMKFLNLSIEYRSSSPFFQPGFFNTTYDYERARFVSAGDDSSYVETKEQATVNNPYRMTGFFGSASANLFNLATFTAGYQQLKPVMPADADTSADKSNSFIANLSVNTDMIPKISEAMAFYIRTNDPKPFDFANPSSNTMWGYRLGYELGPGVSLVYNFQESYRDLDGNGIIEGREEKIRLLTIETALNF